MPLKCEVSIRLLYRSSCSLPDLIYDFTSVPQLANEKEKNRVHQQLNVACFTVTKMTAKIKKV